MLESRNVYVVTHLYDRDGGFGDAVPCDDVVAIFFFKDEAEEFVKRYSNKHCYDIPYAYLYAGELEIEEYPMYSAVRSEEYEDIFNKHLRDNWYYKTDAISEDGTEDE